jgi:hypothetical protein
LIGFEACSCAICVSTLHLIVQRIIPKQNVTGSNPVARSFSFAFLEQQFDFAVARFAPVPAAGATIYVARSALTGSLRATRMTPI